MKYAGTYFWRRSDNESGELTYSVVLTAWETRVKATLSSPRTSIRAHHFVRILLQKIGMPNVFSGHIPNGCDLLFVKLKKKNYGLCKNVMPLTFQFATCGWGAGQAQRRLSRTRAKENTRSLIAHEYKSPLQPFSSQTAAPQPAHPRSWQLASYAGSQATAWPRTQKLSSVGRRREALFRARHDSSSRHSLCSHHPWVAARRYSAVEKGSSPTWAGLYKTVFPWQSACFQWFGKVTPNHGCF